MRMMDEGTSQYYFTASMDSGKTLCSLLKAIQFQEVLLTVYNIQESSGIYYWFLTSFCYLFQTAVFCALPEGLKLTVEEGKCVQASAYVPSDNFTEYHVRDDVDVMFKVEKRIT